MFKGTVITSNDRAMLNNSTWENETTTININMEQYYCVRI